MPHAGAEVSPPVVVVVVSRDPAPERLDALLAALSEQDYPNYRVLVVDAASERDPTAAVARAMPDARVLRLADDDGYGASANRVLDFVEGAELFVFSHDDVLPESDTISTLVAVAREYDAGIVGPKLVAWSDPGRLLQVGMASDRIGTQLPFVEPGELDQAQHDGLREVFVVPGAFTLVRADLFERIGGFDEAVSFVNDDLSLSWRARLAGARVLVTSDARVGHAEAMHERVDRRERQRWGDRHRLRALFMCTGGPRLPLALGQAALLTIGQVVAALVTGRGGRAADAVAAWWWNLRRLRSLLVARRHVRRVRVVGDRQVRKAQVRGIVGPRLQLRRMGGEARAPDPLPADEDDPSAWTTAAVAVCLALAGVLAFGSRHLLTRAVPAVGELVPFGDRPGEMVAEWASGWRHVGLGEATAAPTGLGVLGALVGLAGDAVGLLRTALTLGMLPLGVVGASRLARPLGLRRAQVAAAVAYAVVPVPYNALVGGRWGALVAYAGAPWLIARLAAATGAAPFAPDHERWAPPRHPLAQHVVAVGVTTAAVGLVVPGAPALLLTLAAGLAVGSLVVTEARGLRRLAVAAVGGAAVALVLHLPTTLDLVFSTDRIDAWLGLDRTGELSALDLLRFGTGPFGSAPLGFGVAVAALLPLVVGRAWRLGWGARAWGVAVACWGVVLVQQQGWLGLPLPHADVLLAPAAAGLALAVALGFVAVEQDVKGRSRRFGPRRAAVALAGLALLGAAAPVVAASFDGWWRMPRGDFAGVLGNVADDVAEDPSRVLWVGDPDVLPGGPGWAWRDGLTYATSLEGTRQVRDLWPGHPDGATPRLGEALDLAADGRTTRLGRLLAPMAVQYVAVPLRPAPSPYAEPAGADTDALVEALGSQLDLEQVRVDEGVALFRNRAFAPARALLATDDGFDAATPAEAQGVDLSGAAAVLPGHDGMGFTGTLPPDQHVLVGSTASGRWRLEAGGEGLDRRTAFGWANAYRTGAGGEASLTYESSSWYRLALLAQGALWALALVVVARMRFGGEPLAPSLRATAVAGPRRGPGPGDPGAGPGGSKVPSWSGPDGPGWGGPPHAGATPPDGTAGLEPEPRPPRPEPARGAGAAGADAGHDTHQLVPVPYRPGDDPAPSAGPAPAGDDEPRGAR
jgi:GT2 family glycosyltransferase